MTVTDSVPEAETVPRVPDDIANRICDAAAYAEPDQLKRDFEWLRAHMPLAIAEPEGYDPFWVVSKHADIQEVGRLPLIFNSSDSRHVGARFALNSKAALQKIAEAAAQNAAPVETRSLVILDPPEHSEFRRLTFAEFMPKAIKKLESDLRLLARESVDEMAATGGTCDFYEDVALRYPLRVIFALFGASRSEEDAMLRFTRSALNPADTDLNKDGLAVDPKEGAATSVQALQDFLPYFKSLLDSRRANPTDDLASKIAHSLVNGEPINDWDAISYYMSIMTAGHDTTSSSTAGGIWALAERPELFARIKADRSLIPAFVEESIRWTLPISHFMRTAAQDYTLRGQTIRAGDWLMLAYMSGNHDEDAIQRAGEFLIDRPSNAHVSFGYGAHVCLGQHLARLEMRIFFEELFERLESIEMNGTPRRVDSVFVGGIKSVPIRFTLS